MAIDLFCYSTHSVPRANGVIGAMKLNNAHIFSDKFLISPASEIKDEGKETALEFGIKAQSVFIVGLNEKSEAYQLQAVADLVKNEFGVNAVIVLRDNEELM